MPDDFVVTPWEVKGSVDYDRLVTQFGTERITPEILERIRKITGDVHPMVRRGVFYSHRDLNWILDRYEKGTPFALYTGRGPSSGIHIGHMLPWFFTKWIQEKFRAKLYFQITDDEKFLFKDFDNLEDATKVGYDNILDIIAMGFDPKLTSIFLDTEYIHHLYPIAVEVAKRITYSTTQAVFGFQNANNVGEIFYTSIQAAPAFLPTVEAGTDGAPVMPSEIEPGPPSCPRTTAISRSWSRRANPENACAAIARRSCGRRCGLGSRLTTQPGKRRRTMSRNSWSEID